jgi:hypothetical protein
MELPKHSRVILSPTDCGAAISTNRRVASVEGGMFMTFRSSLCRSDRDGGNSSNATARFRSREDAPRTKTTLCPKPSIVLKSA